MSSPTRHASTAQATIWRSGTSDEWGQKTYLEPEVIACTYDYNQGKTFTDSRGVSFVPSAVVWFEQGSSALPKEGDHIAKGDQRNIASPADAQGALPIKDVRITDCSLFGEPDDVEVLA